MVGQSNFEILFFAKCQFLSLSLTLLCFVFQGWQKCDDPSCGYLTRQVPLTRHRGAATCPACCRAQLHAVVSVSKCCSSPTRHVSLLMLCSSAFLELSSHAMDFPGT